MNQPITFTRHAARRILKRNVDGAVLVAHLEDAQRGGFIGAGLRRIEFGHVRVICDGTLVVTVMDTRRRRRKRVPLPAVGRQRRRRLRLSREEEPQ